MSLGFQFARADGGVELFNGTATTGETTVAVQTTQVAAASRLTSGFNRVIPVAGSTAVLLPMNQPIGCPIVVANYAASALSLNVFPAWNDVTNAAGGGKINNGSANAVKALTQNQVGIFFPHPNGLDWSAIVV